MAFIKVSSAGVLALVAAVSLAACASTGGHASGVYRAANLRPYDVGGRHYSPSAVSHYEAKGLASWYAYPSGTRPVSYTHLTLPTIYSV